MIFQNYSNLTCCYYYCCTCFISGLRNLTDCEFTKRLLNCMFFNQFVSDRGPPWRPCDLFDQVYHNLGEYSSRLQKKTYEVPYQFHEKRCFEKYFP